MKLGVSYAVAFSPDGRYLATTRQRSVLLWSVETDRPVVRRLASFKVLHPSKLAFSPDASGLVVKTTAGRLYCFATRTSTGEARVLRALDCEGAAPAFTACGRFIVDASWSGELALLEASTGEKQWSRSHPGEMLPEVHSADGGRLWIVRHSPRATTATLPPDPDYLTVWTHPFGSHPDKGIEPGRRFVRGSALSRDGTRLALVHGAPPTTIAVLDVEHGIVLRTCSVQGERLREVLAWSIDGQLLAVVRDTRVTFCDENLGVVGVVELDYPSSVAFSPDGRLVALGSWEQGILVETKGFSGGTAQRSTAR
jgi:WD40 repeat protein